MGHRGPRSHRALPRYASRRRARYRSAAHPGEANAVEREFLEAASAAQQRAASGRRPDGPPIALARDRPRRPAGRRPGRGLARDRSAKRCQSAGDPRHRCRDARADADQLARAQPACDTVRPHAAPRRRGERCSRRSRPTVASRPRSSTDPPDSSGSCTSTHQWRIRDSPTINGLIAAPGNDGNIRISVSQPAGSCARCGETVRGRSSPSSTPAPRVSVVSGGIHGKVTIWRVATGKPVGPPIEPGGNVVYGAFTGATGLYTVSDTGVFALWDLHDPKHPSKVGDVFSFPVQGSDVPVAAFGGGPDRNLMAAAGSVSQRTTIFDVDTRRQVAVVDGTPGRFSPDGGTLATTVDDRVVLWARGQTGAERSELSLGSHPAAASSPTFSPDGAACSPRRTRTTARSVCSRFQRPSELASQCRSTPHSRTRAYPARQSTPHVRRRRSRRVETRFERSDAGNGLSRPHGRTAAHRQRSARTVHSRRRRGRYRRRRRQTRPGVRRSHWKAARAASSADVSPPSPTSRSAPPGGSSPPAASTAVSPCGTGPAAGSSRTSRPPGPPRPFSPGTRTGRSS